MQHEITAWIVKHASIKALETNTKAADHITEFYDQFFACNPLIGKARKNQIKAELSSIGF